MDVIPDEMQTELSDDEVKVTDSIAVSMRELSTCNFRQFDDQGRILCDLIKGGDHEVSVQLCSVCPVSEINCQNLRAGLEKAVSIPITVRFANGRVEVWDDIPPTIEFKRAACAAKTMPIHSTRDCMGCPIQVPNVISPRAIQVAHRTIQKNSPIIAPTSIESQNRDPEPDSKRITLQKWLAKHGKKQEETRPQSTDAWTSPFDDGETGAERGFGWTD